MNFCRRRSKSKKSQKDAATAVNATMPDVSVEQVPVQVAATDLLPSDPPLPLSVKEDPFYDSSIVPEGGVQLLC